MNKFRDFNSVLHAIWQKRTEQNKHCLYYTMSSCRLIKIVNTLNTDYVSLSKCKPYNNTCYVIDQINGIIHVSVPFGWHPNCPWRKPQKEQFCTCPIKAVHVTVLALHTAFTRINQSNYQLKKRHQIFGQLFEHVKSSKLNQSDLLWPTRVLRAILDCFSVLRPPLLSEKGWS